MGIPAKSLPRHVREQLGIKLGPGGVARPRLGVALQGHVLLELAIDPPTVTHHDKRIVLVGARGRPTLADSPALVAARRAYERAMPRRDGPEVIPLVAPVVMRVEFRFRGLNLAREWHTEKPDADNSVKLLTDVLAGLGYFEDDAHVSLSIVAKRTAPDPMVRVYLRTLLTPDDPGLEVAMDPLSRHGMVYPLPVDPGREIAGTWANLARSWPIVRGDLAPPHAPCFRSELQR